MNRIKIFLIVFIALILSGCAAKPTNIDELLILKDLSDEQKDIAFYVNEQDKLFEELLKLAQKNSISLDNNKESILFKHGEPIYKNKVIRDGKEQEEWLYRYSTQFFDSEKVYFYFDQNGNLIEWLYKQAK